MRRLMCMFIVIALLLLGCNRQDESEASIELLAIQYLTEGEQNRTPVSPKDSNGEMMVEDAEVSECVGEEYKGKKIYAISFNHSGVSQEDNVVVYIDIDREALLEKAYLI